MSTYCDHFEPLFSDADDHFIGMTEGGGTVTAEKIIRALGYTPASETDLAPIEAAVSALEENKADKTALEAKADKTALDETNRSLDALWKLTEGQIWEWQTVSAQAQSVIAPSGTQDGILLELGGMSKKIDGVSDLISAPVNSWTATKTGGESTTTNLPQSVIDLCPDYGMGVSTDCYNYIDFHNKRYVQRVGKVVLDGKSSEEWKASGSYPGGYYIAMNDETKPWVGQGRRIKTNTQKLLSNLYIYDKEGYRNRIIGTMTADYTVGFMFSNSAADLDLFRTSLQRAPLALCYEFAEEQTVDLSEVLDDEIARLAVEAGGSVAFHYPLENSYDVDVPNTIKYLVKLSEVQ